ncbi:MAG: TlpA family protein disulfide reductase [Cyclobacteriaceae bacterium]|nr:TlpA family protein disulfide reductase [Cyclobacteriaceae bacterium]
MDVKLRILILSVSLSMVLLIIVYLFWTHELQYQLPTPVPGNLPQVHIGDTIQDLSGFGKPVFYHFFNFDCPCSKFNIAEFRQLYRVYQSEMIFIVVVSANKPRSSLKELFNKKYNLDLEVLTDTDGSIAKKFGIYATPQAVIVEPDGRIFYKGNYNLARYCTAKNTRFAAMAIDDILSGKEQPGFMSYIRPAYGCALSSYDASSNKYTILP